MIQAKLGWTDGSYLFTKSGFKAIGNYSSTRNGSNIKNQAGKIELLMSSPLKYFLWKACSKTAPKNKIENVHYKLNSMSGYQIELTRRPLTRLQESLDGTLQKSQFIFELCYAIIDNTTVSQNFKH